MLPNLPASFLALVAAFTLCSSCGGRNGGEADDDVAREVSLDDFNILRRYGWDSVVPDPQPTWNPVTAQVAVRIPTGLGILDEGRNQQQYFTADNGGEYGDPQWIDKHRLVTGPVERSRLDRSGGFLLPVQPLRLLRSEGDTLDLLEEFSVPGYRPRAWNNGSVMVQRGEEMYLVRVNDEGKVTSELFGLGFDPEPQPGGPGVAFNTRPLFYPDLWTGLKGLGELVIRWNDGKTDIIPGAVHPRWTANGGLLVTVLKKEPVEGEVWWHAGVDIMYIPGPEADPILVMPGAHSPAPHPVLDVMAVVTTAGELQLVSFDGQQVQSLATAGKEPSWHPGGRRLMYLKPQARAPYIQILVFHFGAAGDAPR